MEAPSDAVDPVSPVGDERPALGVEAGLRRLLTQEPGPDFYARVMARADGRSMKRLSWRSETAWTVMVLPAVAATVVLFIVSGRPEVRGPQHLGRPIASSPSDPANVGAATASPSPGTGRVARAAQAAVARPRGQRVSGVRAEEVLVPPGQLDAVRRLVAHYEAAPICTRLVELTSGVLPTPPDYDDVAEPVPDYAGTQRLVESAEKGPGR